MAAIALGLIDRAPCLGAKLGVQMDGCHLFVSTIMFGGERWTRVEADECETVHFRGDIDAREAARAYLDGSIIAAAKD